MKFTKHQRVKTLKIKGEKILKPDREIRYFTTEKSQHLTSPTHAPLKLLEESYSRWKDKERKNEVQQNGTYVGISEPRLYKIIALSCEF